VRVGDHPHPHGRNRIRPGAPCQGGPPMKLCYASHRTLHYNASGTRRKGGKPMTTLRRTPIVSASFTLWLSLAVLFLVLTIAPPAARAATDPSPATGHWEGGITLPPGDLQLLIDLVHDGAGWSGTIDIPMQNAKGLPLEEITVQDG